MRQDAAPEPEPAPGPIAAGGAKPAAAGGGSAQTHDARGAAASLAAALHQFPGDRPAATWAGWTAVVLFSIVAGSLNPLTAPPETLVVIAGGLMSAWILWPGEQDAPGLWREGAALPLPPLTRRPAPDRLPWTGIAAWLLVLLALGVWELITLLASVPHAHPTLSALTRPALSHHEIRAAGYLAWLAAGVWIGRR